MRKTAATQFIVVLVALLAVADAAAARPRCEWTGGGGTFTWSTPGNWATGCGRPQNGDSLYFGGEAVQGVTFNDIPGLTIVNIEFFGLADQNGGTRFLLYGERITVTGSITAASPTDFHGTGSAIALPLTLGGHVTIRNAVYSPNAASLFSVGAVDLNGFSLTFDTAVDIDAYGVISGEGSVVKRGLDRLLLRGNSTFGGSVRVVEGPLSVGSDAALGAAGIDDRTIVDPSGVLDITADMTLEEPLLIMGHPQGTLSVRIASDRTVTLRSSVGVLSNTAFLLGTNVQLAMTGPIIAPGQTLDVQGFGTLVVSSPDNLWNRLRIQHGTVRLGAANALARTGNIEFGTVDATLDLNTFDATARALGTSELGGPPDYGIVRLGSATLTLEAPENAPFIAAHGGTITGTGNLVIAGPLVQFLQGAAANTYTGTTTVRNGALVLTKTNGATAIAGPIVVTGGKLWSNGRNQIASTAAVTVNAPGAFELVEAQTETFGSLAGNGLVDAGPGRLVVGGNNTSTTFAGTLKGAALMKAGRGTLTLTGDSTVTVTTATEGTLAINGSLGSAGYVQLHGGILAGSGTVGTIYDATTAPVESTIEPGNSPGILHARTADLRNTFLIVELNGPSPGSGFDQLDVNGDVILFASGSGFTTRLITTRTYGARAGGKFIIIKLAAGFKVTGTFAGLPEGATLAIDGQPFGISYVGGDGNDVVLTALADAPAPPPPPPPPPPTRSYFLAEGATGSFFDDDVLIANPNDAEVPVTLTFFKENGEQIVTSRTLAAKSHATVHVDQLPGLDATAASVRVTSENGLPLLVERTMFWDATSYAGHTGSAIDEPQPDWFFAEGSQGFFDTFVLVVNPNAAAADVTFTFLMENEPPVIQTMPLGAFSRLTLDARSVPALANRSFGITVHATQPIMAERSMYFGTTAARVWTGGHESAGVTAPSTHWFLAEGATGGFFDTFVLLSNPQDTAAHVTLDYLLDSGDPVRVTKTLAPRTRLTTNIEAEDDPRLRDAAVSTVVTSDVPIIAERSMYWPGAATPWGEGHNSFGVVSARTHWGLAEGRVGGPPSFHTYILLANPEPSAAEVTLTYLRASGAPVVRTYVVPPRSRFTIDTSSVAELRDESFGADILVTNNVPIVVERSLYWDAQGISFSGGTNATGMPIP